MSRPVQYILDKKDDTNKLATFGSENVKEGVTGLIIASYGAKTTFTEVYNSDVSETIIEPAEGNSLIVTDAYLAVDSNSGKISLDFENGDPISRLYSSQFHRVSLREISIEGSENDGVVLDADISDGDELIVIIAYVEVEA